MPSALSPDNASSAVIEVGDAAVTVATLTGTTSVLTHRHHRTNDDDGGGGATAPCVSFYQKELDRFRVDAVLAKKHTVPFEAEREKGEDHKKWRSTLQQHCANSLAKKQSASDWIETFLPSWSWLKTYQWKTNVLKDIIAGVTVGIMVIPQGMSFAKLAGLPVQYGLYSTFVPLYAYSLFGSSRHLIIGPVTIISLLVSSGLSDIMEKRGLVPEDPDYQAVYIQLAIQLSFLLGLIYIFMGIARLGFITVILSHAVISGFNSGASLIIALGQVKYIFGYDVPRSDTVQGILKNLLDNISKFNYKTFLLGMTALGMLLAFKEISVKYPKFKLLRSAGAFIVVVIGIVLVAAFDLDAKGIPIIQTIPRGLPPVTVNLWTPIDNFLDMVPVLVTVGAVGFMESVAIAKSFASKERYPIDSSKELIGLGMAHFFGGMFSAYPVAGSFSRSAVNYSSGAISSLSGIVAATLVGLVLLLLTSVFELLPMCIIGAIVIAGVIPMFDYPEAIHLFKIHKLDCLVWMVTFGCVIFLGAELGLGIGVALSLLIVVVESAIPPYVTVLGRLPGTSAYRSKKQYPEAEQVHIRRGCLVTRIEEPLYFANAQSVSDRILRLLDEAGTSSEEYEGNDDDNVQEVAAVKYVIVDLTPVARIDSSALYVLDDLHLECQSRGKLICWVNPNIPVMNRLTDCGLVDRVGKEHFFSTTFDAVASCLAEEMDQEGQQDQDQDDADNRLFPTASSSSLELESNDESDDKKSDDKKTNEMMTDDR